MNLKHFLKSRSSFCGIKSFDYGMEFNGYRCVCGICTDQLTILAGKYYSIFYPNYKCNRIEKIYKYRKNLDSKKIKHIADKIMKNI